MSGEIGEARASSHADMTMTPEQQARQKHIYGMAQILYEDTPAEHLTTLGSIEQAVREQMLQHVMPEVGIFLLTPPTSTSNPSLAMEERSPRMPEISSLRAS